MHEGIHSLTNSAFSNAAPVRAPSPTETNNPGAAGAVGSSFGQMMAQALSDLNQVELAAEQATHDLALGKTDDILGAVMTSEQANLAMGTVLKVRQDALDAYEQVMRMSL